MRRVLPTPAIDTTVEEAYAAPLGRHGDRPWVGLCMVASIDGSIAVDGTSGGLSSATDAAVLGRLRSVADVLVVGAGTVRAEGYGAPSKSGQRLGVVTRRGDVDAESELFRSGAGFVITTRQAEVPSGVEVLRAGDREVDLADAIRRLGEVTDRYDHVQAEGGAALNGALLEADLLDELDVTTAPTTVGGGGPRLANGAGAIDHRFELAQLAIDDDAYLFARWLRRR
jgi:riboflavin biosynthesis pyrimidine reductase